MTGIKRFASVSLMVISIVEGTSSPTELPMSNPRVFSSDSKPAAPVHNGQHSELRGSAQSNSDKSWPAQDLLEGYLQYRAKQMEFEPYDILNYMKSSTHPTKRQLNLQHIKQEATKVLASSWLALSKAFEGTAEQLQDFGRRGYDFYAKLFADPNFRARGVFIVKCGMMALGGIALGAALGGLVALTTTHSTVENAGDRELV